MQIRYITIFLSFFVFSNLLARDDNSMEIISVSQGLPNSNINEIYLGKKGLMWIGTANGLCFYDGYAFNIIQSVPFDSTTLADDNIRRITQNSSLNIWLHTNYGIEKIDHLTGNVHRVKHIPNSYEIIDVVSSPLISDVFLLLKNSILRIDAKNNVDTIIHERSLNIKGATLVNQELIALEEESLFRYKIKLDELEQIKLKQTLSTDETAGVIHWENYILYSESNKLYALNLSNADIKLLYTANEEISSISQPINNVISFTTLKNIYSVELRGGINNYLLRKQFQLEGYNIQHTLQDSNQLLWISTNRGVVKLNPHSTRIEHAPISSKIIKINNMDDLVYESSKQGIVYSSYQGLSFINTAEGEKPINLALESCNSFAVINDEYYLAGNDMGLFKLNIDGTLIKQIKGFDNTEVYSVKVLDDIIWVSTRSGLYRGVGDEFEQLCDFKIDRFIVFDNHVYFTSEKGFGQLDINSCTNEILLAESSQREYVRVLDILQSYNGEIWLATDDGLYQYNTNAAGQYSELFKLVYKGNVLSLIESTKLPEVWFSTDLGIGAINYQTQQIMFLGYEDGVRQTSFIQEGAVRGANNNLLFLTQHEVISFNPDSVFRNKNVPKVSISQANSINNDLSNRQLYYSSDTFYILPNTRIVELSFTTFDYFAPLHTIYEYSLTETGELSEWKILDGNMISLGAVAPGEYTLNVRAKNSHGLQSEKIKQLTIIVKAPIYRSKIAAVIYFILLVFIIIIIIQLRTRTLSRKNREYKEKERIAKKVEQQKEELTLKNKNITDSINYARRIQLAMMPSIRLFNTIFPDSFILHMPKDIVSGDFYWVNHVKNKIFFSAVDCTGHGVPGAFMSIIGVELFRRITEIEKIFTPAEVLNSLSKNFERVFGDVNEMKLRDGMDLAFCSLNEEQTILEYAGAFNPLYIVRNNSIMEIKGDRQSVGVYEEEDEIRSFNNHVIPLQDEDIIYIFTDGYVDQFGGPEGKKYKYRRFRHLLLALHQLPMDKQIEFLKKSILEWKGEQEQVDDILVMGIRIHQNTKKES